MASGCGILFHPFIWDRCPFHRKIQFPFPRIIIQMDSMDKMKDCHEALLFMHILPWMCMENNVARKYNFVHNSFLRHFHVNIILKYCRRFGKTNAFASCCIVSPHPIQNQLFANQYLSAVVAPSASRKIIPKYIKMIKITICCH